MANNREDPRLDPAPEIEEESTSDLPPLPRSARIEAVLRELIWRMDHVRSSLRDATTVDRTQLLAMLDTSDALRALGINTHEAHDQK